ncbi:MAG: hypothetical protein EXR76_03025 [Myxococcales bacterium]|nr:hypothetical protein [Myxococcales bacterium]
MRYAFIAAFLAVQVLLPLRYYAGEDRFDERFAWRMFSNVRVVACQTRFTDASDGGATPVRASAEIHEVWTSLLNRARRSVIDGFARKWCSERSAGGGQPVLHVDVTCQNPETLGQTICRGTTTDANADGVPDLFGTDRRCAGKSAADCFRAACGEQTAAACREALCMVRPIAVEENLCD